MNKDINQPINRFKVDSEEVKDFFNVDLTLLSYNVLLPISNKVFQALTNPKRRYEYHFNTLFPSLNPDILCLQEVTPMYIQMLENSDFYIEGGYSHSEPADFNRNGHCPLIISKLPMKILKIKEKADNMEDISNLKDSIVIAEITQEGTKFIVICAHLSAFEQNVGKREKEMKKLDLILKELNLES